MTETKKFGAFVRQAGKAGIDKAAAVAPYVGKATDGAYDVRESIERDLRKGLIDEARRDTLFAAVEACSEAWREYGKIIDRRDPRDWADLGNGARMRRTHRDSERVKDPHALVRYSQLQVENERNTQS